MKNVQNWLLLHAFGLSLYNLFFFVVRTGNFEGFWSTFDLEFQRSSVDQVLT